MEVMTSNKKVSKKNIWFFHHYAALPSMNGHIRPFNFGKLLKQSGMESTVFASSYLHFADVNLIDNNSKYLVNEECGIPFVFVNTPSSSKGSLARIKNMAAFYFRLLDISKEYAKTYGKPEVIIASSPHPLTMLAGIQVAKKFKVPCICEIRDLWPEAIFSFGKLKETSLLGKILIAGEHWIYKNADALIFTKEGDTDYIKERKWDIHSGGDIDLAKCHYINNGVDLESFLQATVDNQINDSDLLNDKFNVIYAGAIRPVNNVGNILDAAALLKDHTNIQFLIYGDGNQLVDLKKRVVAEGLTNVKMKGYVNKRFIPFILGKASVNILNYSQSQYNWSRGNSSNKLFEYMASGKPIVSTVKMGYCIIDKYKCGFSLENSSPEELAKIIIKVYNLPKEEYAEIARNARSGAADFDYKTLTNKLIKTIESVIT